MVSLGSITILAVITMLAIMVTMRRIMSFRLIFGYALFIDTSFTVLLVVVFRGTVSGSASAALAGLLLALVLTGGKFLFGYQKVSIRRRGLKVRYLVRDYDGWIASRYGEASRVMTKRKNYAGRAYNLAVLYN